MDITSYFKVCKQFNISLQECLLLKVLLLIKNNDFNSFCVEYFDTPEIVRGSLRKNLLRLQEIDLIDKSYKIPEVGEKLDITSIKINRQFEKAFYKTSFELGKQLFESFPQFITIKGNQIGARRVSNKFNSLEEAFETYGRSILWDFDKHKKVIEAVEWGKTHKLINCTLATFILDRVWEELETLNKPEIKETLPEFLTSELNL